MNYNKFFLELKDNSSRNYKQHILEVNSGDELLKEIIFLALDPGTVFGIKKLPKYTPNEGNVALSLQDSFQYLYQISHREVTGNAAKDLLKLTLEKVSSDDAQVIIRIINKKLDCGVSAKTVNEVWPGLIPEWPCMLCEDYDPEVVFPLAFPLIVQKKEDGGRINAVVHKGECELKSRNGNIAHLDDTIKKMFIDLADGEDLVFDGELLVKNKSRSAGNGYLNKAIKGTIKQSEIDEIYFVLWDVISYKDFFNGKSNVKYCKRFSDLENKVYNKPEYDRVKIVESVIINSFDEITTIFRKYIDDGYEGVIAKDIDGIWESKRVNYNIKFKNVLECDLLVIDIEPGQGKYLGMIGSLICESEDGLVKVSVGSGLTDADRVNDIYIGNIISVKYNSRISDKRTGQMSLFLPIYKGLRLDKHIADFEKDIKYV